MATYDETLIEAVERAAALLREAGPLTIWAISSGVFDDEWFFAQAMNPIQSLAQRMRGDPRFAYDRETRRWHYVGGRS